MNALIAAIIRNRVASNLLLVFLLVAGGLSMATVKVRLFPEIVPNQIRVSVAYPGATPEEVEASIVEPIEERVEGLEGVREVRSQATSNLGQVTVELLRNADVNEKRDEVKAQIDRIAVFPEGSEEPEVVEVEAREQILQLVVSADLAPTEVNLRIVKNLAERVRDDLTALPGVSQVTLGGVPEDRIEIAIERGALERYGTSLAEIARIVRASSRDLSAGELEASNERLLVRTLGENETAEEFRDVIVASSADGTGVRLGDIAAISEGFEDAAVVTRLNDRPAAYVTVFRAGDEKVLGLVRTVERYLEERLAPELPESLEVSVWRNDGKLLEGRLRLLIENGALGLLLVLTVLTLFLDLRIAGWVAAGIGVAFVGSFALMNVFGVALNVISLFGFILAIGIVVDDAIVVGENVYAQQMEDPGDGADDCGPLERAVAATQRVSRPVFFAVFTTIATFVPLLFLPGTVGQFVDQIAAIVIFTLLLSLTESFFVLPHHLAAIRPQARPHRLSPRRLTDALRDRVDAALTRFAEGPLRLAVRFCIDHALFTLACAVALLLIALSLPVAGYVKFVFFPEVQGNYVTASVELPQSTPEETTLDVARSLEAAARSAAQTVAERHGTTADIVLDGVLVSVGTIPRAPDPGAQRPAGMRPQFASVVARIMDAEIRPFDAQDFSAAWRQATPPIAGLRELTFSASLVNVGAAVALEVSSDDQATTDDAVARLRAELEDMQGVHDVRDDRFRTTDEIGLSLLPAARAYGLTLADLAGAVRDALYGAEALRLQRGREEVEVRVRLPEEQRDSVADLLAYEIPLPGDPGTRIPLAAVADIVERPAPARITRRAGRRIVTLSADTNSDVISGGEATRYLLAEVVPVLKSKNPGLRVTVAGEQEERGRSAPALARNFSLAVFVIYALLSLALSAYTQPLVILACMPFGLIGALLGHFLLGLNLTLLSIFGFIGLTGVIVNDALLMVDFFNARFRGGMEVPEAITEAALDRFRPILLTSLTTFFGVFPLILETSVQARFLIPTAVSLGFGILFGTLLLMLLVPALLRLHAGVSGLRPAAEVDR